MHTQFAKCLRQVFYNLIAKAILCVFLLINLTDLFAFYDNGNLYNSSPLILIDTDSDGIDDSLDQDDDNDGITDADESICGIDLSVLTYYGDGIQSMDADSIVLMNTPGWRTSYANEVFSLPIHLEFKTEIDNYKMIGFLPVDSTETVTGWNDGAYKLYVHLNSRIYGKVPGVWTFSNGVTNGTLVEMDIDVNGNLTVSFDGNLSYSGTAPAGDYRLAVSTYLGGRFNQVGITHGNSPCTLFDIDTDDDGIANRMDLDSDDDMCVDAFEGGGDFSIFDMDGAGKLLGAVNTNPNSTNYGIPVIAASGQSIGGSQQAYMIVPDTRACVCMSSAAPPDADSDLICDDADLCDGFDDTLIGTVCNDGDNCTINDIWTTHCDCRGIFFDSDGDNICDLLDTCPDFDDDIDVDNDGIPDCIDACIDVDEDLICDDQDPMVDANKIKVLTTHRRGFYEQAFDLGLVSDDPVASIYYTIDGSVPASSSSLFSGSPIGINSTTILRTIAIHGQDTSAIETHSFIFLDDIITDPSLRTYITNHPRWGGQLKEALSAIPSISIVSDSTINEFNKVSGSMEMLYPDKDDNFQSNCGLGHYGNASLNLPKRNMRMYFDSIYGNKNLNKDVFEGFANGVGASNKFDKLDLRSSHESWLWDSGIASFEGETYIATALMDNIMLRGSTPNPHNRFVHVYVDGNYWGQYDLREKFDDNMIAEYLGGDNSDYNFISGSKVTVSAFSPIFGVMKDSINNDWQTLINASTDYTSWKTMVNENSFFDMMVLFMYGFAEAEWNAVGAPTNGKEFVFQVNDADLFFSRGIPEWTNRTYPQHNANGPANMFLNLFNEGHPDFLNDFADRASLLLDYDGQLTPQTLRNHIDELAAMINVSIIGEAAKWSGDSSENPSQWAEKLESFKVNMVDIRNDIVIDQMKHTGIYPIFDPVDYSVASGLVPANTSLQLINPNSSGQIYYTLDGTDPRLTGGTVSGQSSIYQNPILLAEGAYQINARVKGTEVTYPEINIGTNKPITASRLLGNTLAEVANDGQIWGIYNVELEAAYIANNGAIDPWLEIDLESTQAIDIVRFWERSEFSANLNAVDPYVFISNSPFSSDDPNALIADPNVETFIYQGNAVEVFEIAVNTQGRYVRVMFDQITVFFCSELEIIQLDINNPVTKDVWSPMVAQNFYIEQDYENLVINEIHYNPYDEIIFNPTINAMDTVAGRNFEFIELTNIGEDPIHLLGTIFTKGIQYEIDELLVLQPGGFFVFAEDPFWFEQKYGIVADGRYTGKLDNGGEKINYKDPFGNIIDSLEYNDGGDWPGTADKGFYSLGLKNPTLDNALGTNWGIQAVFTTPRAENYFTDFGQHSYSGLVINEIHYNPFDGVDNLGNTVSGTEYEFIELKNISTVPINLTDVFFSRGIEYFFPDNTIIQAGDFIVLAEDSTHFHDRYGFAAFATYSGKLSNSGETIWLSKENGTLLDIVSYEDAFPWDSQADGGPIDYSLALIDGEVNNNTRLNWKVQCANIHTPGAENDFSCFTGLDYTGLTINEIHYNPSGGINYEFIEITNHSTVLMDLEGISISSGIFYSFESQYLPGAPATPLNTIVLAKDSASFHNTYGFAAHGNYIGVLSNSGETIVMQDLFGELVDEVTYDDVLPWDPLADQGAKSLALLSGNLDNSLASSWCTQDVNVTPKAINTFGDADNDMVLDCQDQCPGQDDGDIGLACNDGDPCTTGETYDSVCNCTGGQFQDADNDGVCDANDLCQGSDDMIDSDLNGIPDGCEDCADEVLQLTHPIIDKDTAANLRIMTNGTVTAGYDIDYHASQSVELLYDFEVKMGAVFHAYISPCQ